LSKNNSLTNDVLVLDNSFGGTAGCTAYIDTRHKILHINLYLTTCTNNTNLGALGGFAPPSSERYIPFNCTYTDNTIGYGLVQVDTTGSIKILLNQNKTVSLLCVTGECYIG
jgi:hypothetical protein